jgi:virginiamycin A acetyltransferase
MYATCAHLLALAPGPCGDFLRAAYYSLTLRGSSSDTRIGYGSFFVHPGASIGRNVSVGAYCVIGNARIGDRTQIASHVQITSGRRQHLRDEAGRMSGSSSLFEVDIGADCWIGAAAVVMASVGSGSTIGAGAIVVHRIPPGVVAVGNPARPVLGKDADPARELSRAAGPEGEA